MSLNYVTLTGTVSGAKGAIVSFFPAGWEIDTADQQIIAPLPVTATLDENGHFSVSLLATDNSAPQPGGWTWTCYISEIEGLALYTFSFFLPFSGGATQDLSALAQVPAVTPSASYLPLPSGAATSGYVPIATGSGENSAWGPQSGGGGGSSLAPTAVKTANYSAVAGDYVPCDTTSGPFTVTLPSAPADKTAIGVKIVTMGVLSSTVTIAAAGSDVFNKAGGSATLTLSLLNQGALLEYSHAAGIWYVQADDLALSQLDARYGLQGPTRGYRPTDITYIDMPYSGQSSGGATMTTSGGTGNTADTSDFVLGVQATKVATLGAGGNTKITAAFGASPLNMTGKSLVLWVKMENLGHFSSGYPRAWLGDTGLANAYEWKIGSAFGQPWNLDGEWMRITLPFGAAAVVGSPSRASLGNLIIQVFDDNTGNPVTVHIGGIATMNEPATAFPNGVVSITFDDGLLGQFTNAKPLMDSFGYRGTAYLITETLWNHGAGFGSYVTLAQAQALEAYSGWEIGSHAFTAANHNSGYVNIGDAAALADMQAAKAYLISEGFKAPEQFAYPLGAYDSGTVANAASVFGSGRSISSLGSFPDETFPPAQLSRLRSYPVSETSGIVSAAGYITAAQANKEWLIFTFHDIQGSASGNLQLSTAHFSTLLTDIQAAGIQVLPVSEVLKQTETQYTIGVAAADTSVVVGGTLAKPTVRTGTLDVIAADHPPVAAVAMNSQKITGLANGVASTDAATVAQIGSGGGVASVTAGDTSIVIGGTGSAPTVATNTLDVIAADHPAAADWSNNSHKITSLAAGSAGTDAANIGQVALLTGAAFTGAVSLSESAAAGGILTVVNSHTTPTAPSVQYAAQTAADLVVGVQVTADTNERFTIDSNGKLQWGTGAAGVDTSLSRVGAGALQTNSFRVSNSASGGNVLTVTNTNAGVPTAPNVELVAHAAADPELGIGVTGDTVFRLVADSNGKLSWGPGGATAADTVVQRSGAGVLQVTTGHLDLNSNKITTLANGTVATDAAAYGQTVSGGAPGAVLATQYYAPGAVSDKTITTTTLTPFDTTNLTVSFTAPPSGKVMVEVSALVLPVTGIEWNLGLTLHGSPSTVIGALYNSRDGSGNTQTARPFKFYVTGLTPGASLQYDVSGCSFSGALAIACYGDTSTTPTADNIGSPFIMEVFAR